MYTDREKWAYIAGFVDGEGTISIKRSSTKNRPTGQFKLGPYVEIANTDEKALRWIKSVLDFAEIRSAIYSRPIRKRLSEPQLDAKKLYCLHIGGLNQLVYVLDMMLPFLVVKKRAANIVREYIILRLSKLPKNRLAPYGDEEKRLYNSIKQRGFRFKIA